MRQSSNSQSATATAEQSQQRQARTALTPISYNTEPYLRLTLEQMRDEGMLTHWCYIKHKGEYDLLNDCREKDHAHVYALLAKTVSVASFLARFKEPDPAKPDKPLGAVLEIVDPHKKHNGEMFRMAGWLLYGIHDEQMEEAGHTEPHEFHYGLTDIKTDDRAWLARLWKHLSRRCGEFEDLRRPSLNAVGQMVIDGEITPQEALRRRWVQPVNYRALCGIQRDRLLGIDNSAQADAIRAAEEIEKAAHAVLGGDCRGGYVNITTDDELPY